MKVNKKEATPHEQAITEIPDAEVHAEAASPAGTASPPASAGNVGIRMSYKFPVEGQQYAMFELCVWEERAVAVDEDFDDVYAETKAKVEDRLNALIQENGNG